MVKSEEMYKNLGEMIGSVGWLGVIDSKGRKYCINLDKAHYVAPDLNRTDLIKIKFEDYAILVKELDFIITKS